MGLLDAFRKQRVAQQQSKADLFKEIRDILLRRNQPKGKDAQRLVELCEQEGISEKQIELWAAVLDANDRFGAEVTAATAAEVELQKIADAAAPIEKRIGELRAELESLYEPNRVMQLRQALTTGHTRRPERESLQRAVPWLAGDFASAPNARLDGQLWNLQHSLGLNEGQVRGWVPPTVEVEGVEAETV